MPTYRKNVGVVVFNQDKKVLLCKRADSKFAHWQFPQGGIEPQEDVLSAAKRELCEETGLCSVEFVAQTEAPFRYDFPPEILENHKRKGIFHAGQDQWWVLFYFAGDEAEIDFCTNPQEIEFDAFEWVDMTEAVRRIVEFKKEVYRQVEQAFAAVIHNWSK